MTQRSPRDRDTNPEEQGLNVEHLNLREALRLARNRANRERNRVKCKKYYRKRRGKTTVDTVSKDDPEMGVI